MATEVTRATLSVHSTRAGAVGVSVATGVGVAVSSATDGVADLQATDSVVSGGRGVSILGATDRVWVGAWVVEEEPGTSGVSCEDEAGPQAAITHASVSDRTTTRDAMVSLSISILFRERRSRSHSRDGAQGTLVPRGAGAGFPVVRQIRTRSTRRRVHRVLRPPTIISPGRRPCLTPIPQDSHAEIMPGDPKRTCQVQDASEGGRARGPAATTCPRRGKMVHSWPLVARLGPGVRGLLWGLVR